MPKARLIRNQKLPRYWRYRKGAYYFRVPIGQEHLWDGKREYWLGKNYDEAMSRFSKALSGSAPEDISEYLIEDKKLFENCFELHKCGIYFLLNGEEIVYIGQSTNVLMRLNSHTDKDWDRAFVLKAPEPILMVVEAHYIQKFEPKYNAKIPNSMGIVFICGNDGLKTKKRNQSK